ncbi:hypothetical protein [Arcanobacterium hippocoleae]|uniref:hypothetical protein n=1 Tax=Arcanobacterium hippocoleae TaxID=149017 RepID=UPI00333E6B37
MKKVAALLGAFVIAAGGGVWVQSPAQAAAIEPMTFTKQGTDKDTVLQWSFPGCNTKPNNKAIFDLYRDGQLVLDDTTETSYATKGVAGTYRLEGKCDRSANWLTALIGRPLTLEVAADTVNPKEDEILVDSKENEMTIKTFAFSEIPTKRSLSWDVTGCSVRNKKTVKVELYLGDKQVSLKNTQNGRKAAINSSTWPTGNYTLKAKCVSLDGKKTFKETSATTKLTRANLGLDFFGDKLDTHLPKPGDRVKLDSRPSHNGISLVDKSVPDAFEPGEKVEIKVLADGQPVGTPLTVAANNEGRLLADLWLPITAKDTYSVIAVGKNHCYQLDAVYKVQAPRSTQINVTSDEETLRIVSTNTDPLSTDKVFKPNSEVALRVLDPAGKEIAAPKVMAGADGNLNAPLELPKSLADGRYTVLAPGGIGSLGARAAYFYVLNGVAYKGWGVPDVTSRLQLTPAVSKTSGEPLIQPEKEPVESISGSPLIQPEKEPVESIKGSPLIQPEKKQIKSITGPVLLQPAKAEIQKIEKIQKIKGSPLAHPAKEVAELAKTGSSLLTLIAALVLLSAGGAALLAYRRR